jgi:hypothetical protein
LPASSTRWQGHDDHEGIAADRLRHRIDRAGSAQAAGDLVIGAGFAARDGPGNCVDALVEAWDISHIQRDVGQVGSLPAQQRDDALDGDFDIFRRPLLARVGIEQKQPPAGFDLAGFGELHADDTQRAPCDPAPANSRVKNAVPTPRHTPPTPRAS